MAYYQSACTLAVTELNGCLAAWLNGFMRQRYCYIVFLSEGSRVLVR